ncbi:MAG: hypothetical protein VYE40_04900 [Myxococcota bacterium]|nr:hypothetical protein [Myxococcota bacterium]
MISRHSSARSLLAMFILSATLTGCDACGTDGPRDEPGERDMNTANARPGLDIGTPPNNSNGDMSDARDMPDDNMDMGARPDQSSTQDMDTPPQDMSGDDMSTPGDMAQGGEDMGPTEDMTPPVQTCLSKLTLASTFDVDGGGVAGQYYSRAAFDGEAVWVVYNKREAAGAGDGDIWAARYACDGSAMVAPFQVNTGGGMANDYHPNLAIRGEDLYVLWSREEDGANFPVMRAMRTDGTGMMAQEAIITPEIAGEPLSNLIWETDVTALPGGEAAFTASFASEKAGTFQIVVQRFDRTGALVGDALEAFEEKGVEQTRPSITSLEDGTLYVSWTRYKAADAMAGSSEEPPRVVYTRFAPGATEPDVAGPFPAQPGATGDNQLSRYSKERTIDDKVYLAFQLDSTGENDVLVKDGTFGAPLAFGTIQGSAIDLRPSVAGRVEGGGGAIAWFRADPSPIGNSVHVASFQLNGNSFSIGQEIDIPTSNFARPPYGPAIAHVSGDIYFITWSEGSSTGNTMIKGRFVKP